MYLLYNATWPAKGSPHGRRVLLATLLLLSLVFFSNDAQAQESEPTQWTFLKEVENLRFFYTQTECETQPFLLLKVENLGSSQVFGNWHLNVTADGLTKTYLGLLVDMQPMAIKEGNCKTPDPHLVIPWTRTTAPLEITLDVQLLKP